MSFAVYVLDWAGALMGKGVWVRMHWHEAADAYRDVVDGAGLPIGQKRHTTLSGRDVLRVPWAPHRAGLIAHLPHR